MKFGTNDLSYVCLGKKVLKVVIIKRQKKEKSIRSIKRNQKKKKINKKNTSKRRLIKIIYLGSLFIGILAFHFYLNT